ncbi:MAG: cytochrome c biosis transrane protein [Candidatus Magasanikbacteria bacterium]|nr:cytochrome c biosis transrane protein [Candidatus Magasanikbacteria bacterium]
MKKKWLFIIVVSAAFVVVSIIGFSGAAGAGVLWKISNGGQLLLPLVTVAAVVDSINPCAFSILILTIAFLASIGKLRGRILAIGGTYIFGIFAVYILIGLGILQTLHLFNTPHFMAKIGAGILIVLGLVNLVNEYFPSFPIKLRIPQGVHHRMAALMDRASAPTAFLLGALVGLCEFPCTGGPYLMVLGLLHDNATFLRGLAYLLYYNLIFILPLVIILVIASKSAVIEKVQVWQARVRGKMRWADGLLMVILGVIIFLL